MNSKSIKGRYGFAMLDGEVFLVQLLSHSESWSYEAHVYRHNFVSLFSYSHSQTLSPESNLLEILEAPTDDSPSTKFLLEEDTNTVFVAPEVMSRYIWLKDRLAPRMMGINAGKHVTGPSQSSGPQRPNFLSHGFNRGSRSRIIA